MEMTSKNSSLFRLAYADCIVQKLWQMGLISDAEKDIIDSKNKVSFLSN